MSNSLPRLSSKSDSPLTRNHKEGIPHNYGSFRSPVRSPFSEHFSSSSLQDYIPSLKTFHSYFTSSSSSSSEKLNTGYNPNHPPTIKDVNNNISNNTTDDDAISVKKKNTLYGTNTSSSLLLKEWNEDYDDDGTLPVYSNTYGVSSSIARTILRKRTMEKENRNCRRNSISSPETPRQHTGPTLMDTHSPSRSTINSSAHSSSSSSLSSSTALATLSGIISKLMDHRPDLNPFSSHQQYFTPVHTSSNTRSSSLLPTRKNQVVTQVRTLTTTGSPLLGPIIPPADTSQLSTPMNNNTNGTVTNSSFSIPFNYSTWGNFESKHNPSTDYQQLTEYARNCARKLEQTNQEKFRLQEDMVRFQTEYETKLKNLEASYRIWNDTLHEKETELYRKEQQLKRITDMLEESRRILQSRTLSFVSTITTTMNPNPSPINSGSPTGGDRTVYCTDKDVQTDNQTMETNDDDSLYFSVQHLLAYNDDQINRYTTSIDRNEAYVNHLRIMVTRLYDRNRYLHDHLRLYKLLLLTRPTSPSVVSALTVTDQTFVTDMYNRKVHHRLNRHYQQQMIRDILESTTMDIRKNTLMHKLSPPFITTTVNSTSSNSSNGNLSNHHDHYDNDSYRNGNGLSDDSNSIYSNPSSKSTAGGASILSFRLWHDFDKDDDDNNNTTIHQQQNTHQSNAMDDNELASPPLAEYNESIILRTTSPILPSLSITQDTSNRTIDPSIPSRSIFASSSSLPLHRRSSSSSSGTTQSVASSTENFSFPSLSSSSSSYSCIPSLNSTIIPSTSIHPQSSSLDTLVSSQVMRKDVSVQTTDNNNGITPSSLYLPFRYPPVSVLPTISTVLSTDTSVGRRLRYSSRAAYQGLLLAQQIEEEAMFHG